MRNLHVTAIFIAFVFCVSKLQAQCANFSVTLITSNVTTPGGTDGSIQINITGGCGSPQFSIYPYTNDLTHLSAGTYTIDVQDCECGTTVTTTITEPSPTTPVVTLSTTDVSCHSANDGSITANPVIGGTPPYDYLWSNGGTNSSITNLAPNIYTLTVTDANNQTTTANAIISQPDSVWAEVYTYHNVTTNGGSDGIIVIEYNNTLSVGYAWSPPIANSTGGGISPDGPAGSYYFSDLPAGTYNVTITYGIGCTIMASTTITEPACSALFSVAPDNNIPHNWIANNLSSAGNPLTYTWYWGDGDSSTGVAPSHTYSQAGYIPICLVVDDGLGCTSTFCDSSTYIYKTEEVISIQVINQTNAPTTPSGIHEAENANNGIRVFPNPFTDKLNVAPDVPYRLYDLVGREMDKTSLPQLPVGTYILQTKYGSARVTKITK